MFTQFGSQKQVQTGGFVLLLATVERRSGRADLLTCAG